MKNKFLYIIMSAFFLTVSCKKQLEDKIYDRLVPVNYFNNDGEAISVANSIYGALNGTGWDYYGAGNERIQMLHDATTDLFAPTGGSGYYPNLNYFNWKPEDASFRVNWQGAYKGIGYCNYILQYLPASTKVSDAIKKRVIAEAKTGLGLFYRDLVELFGDVPLIKSFDEGITASPARTPANEVLNYAAEQLKAAIPDLPVSYSSGDNGRFTKGAANALLVKIYLDQKNWDGVIAAANSIISGGYQLDPSYASLFTPENQNNKEFILVKQAFPDFNTGNSMPTYCLPPDYKLPTGVSIQIWNVYRIRRAFYESFDPADVRKASIVDRYPNNNGGTTIIAPTGDVICMKYAFDSKANIVFATNDMPLIRLADIILAKAEALNQKSGPNQESVDLINQIRMRAFNNDITKNKSLADFASKDALNAWILKERGWELYFEGHRRMDLIRHGKFLEMATARGATDPSAKRL
ncbi:MAG: RagB/SusD family nutrient uptake outer membrane protein, partial [Ginsengibacter sp.]